MRCERCGAQPLGEQNKRVLCGLSGENVCRHCEDLPGHHALHDLVLTINKQR
jgi:hypothetical protein